MSNLSWCAFVTVMDDDYLLYTQEDRHENVCNCDDLFIVSRRKFGMLRLYDLLEMWCNTVDSF